jgi:ATP-dependent helicase/nuclease subunit A
MPEPRPALTEEQLAAIEDREGDLFLVAGAGTGKTTVLVDRFCDVVCARAGADADSGIGNVLAFTFTERAAGQLKRRIRAELLRRAQADPGRGAELRRLARDSEAAWISTIHGFCQRVLSSHSLAAGLDPGYVVVDEAEAERMGREAFEHAFLAFGGAGGDDDRFEMAAAYGFDNLRRMIAAAHDELRSQGRDAPELPAVAPVDPRASVARLREAAQRALEETAGCTQGWAQAHRQKIAEALAATHGRTPEEGEPASWCFSSSAADFDLDSVRDFVAACRELDRGLAEAAFAHYYGYVRELMTLFRDGYAALKRRRSALDFEDLQLAARNLLRSSPEVRHAYQRRFHHLMVDEFQDTNALQVSLIDLLHREDGEPVNRLFTVGDELQSIYGFRHADVEVFRAFSRRAPNVRALTGNFRSGRAVLALVNAIGAHLFPDRFAALAPGDGEAGGAAASPPGAIEVLVTQSKGWPDEVAFTGVSADEQAQPWRLAEADALARRLRELVGAGEPRGDIVLLLRSYGHVRAYEAALAAAGLRPYVIGGRGYWSRQQVADVRALLGCVANAQDDRALVDAMASPACGVRPDTLWLLRRAAGTAPLWWAVNRLFGPPAPAAPEDGDGEGEGGDDGESWGQRVARWGAAVPDDDAALLRRFVSGLERVRSAAPTLALDALVDRVVTETGYDLALLMRPGGRRRMANVRKLMRLAREFEADEGRDLRAFLDWAAAETETTAREAEATIQAEGHDGVRVMTIHAAKGLEFPVVAVADLGRGLGARGAGSALRLAPDREGAEDDALRVGLRLARLGRRGRAIFHYQELADAAAERDREEERRLLHVAMTRAERRLVLSGAADIDALEKQPGRGEPLMGAVLRALGWSSDDGRVELAGSPAGRARVEVRLTRPPEEGAAEPLQLPLEIEAAVDEPPGPPLGALVDPELAPPAMKLPTPPVTHVSYSALSLYSRCAYRFYAEQVLGLGGAPAAGPAPKRSGPPDEQPEAGPLTADEVDTLEHRYALGRVVHELLEAGARAAWARPSPERISALLAREGVTAAPARERVERMVAGFLESPLRRDLDGARALHPELPFAFRLGELIVRGEIDLLAEFADHVTVIDYKSDALGGDQPQLHMDRYETQRTIYALAALRRYGLPVQVVYAFLERPDQPVVDRFEPEDAPALTRRLEGAAEGILAGRFEVTDSPGRALCFDCPARRRLCSWTESATLA